jgi:nucleotide-binding universal stress UspA family protein
MVETLVVPLDGSRAAERAAPIAASLAHRLGAEVLLVAVSSLEDEARSDLERVTRDGAFSARQEVINNDDAAESIRRVVGRSPAPALCMSTHGRGRVGHAVLGSTAEQLLRNVGVPFVLIGPHCSAAWPTAEPRLLACLDESEISEAVLARSVEWCRALDLEMWMAQVFHPLDVASAQAPYRYLDVVSERLRSELSNVKACAAWGPYVPGEILHLADVLSVSMIAMGSHGRTGLGRLALGSVTMAVTHRARCPVLAVRTRYDDADRVLDDSIMQIGPGSYEPT